jgi:hypothetical protein
MGKKNRTPENPMTCGHHEDALTTVVDMKRSCATCAARRVLEMSKFVNPRALFHYIDLNESNADFLFNRLEALHSELVQQAREQIQTRTGSMTIERTHDGRPHPEFAPANRLSAAIYHLKKHWAWMRRTENGNKTPATKHRNQDRRRFAEFTESFA